MAHLTPCTVPSFVARILNRCSYKDLITMLYTQTGKVVAFWISGFSDFRKVYMPFTMPSFPCPVAMAGVKFPGFI